MKHYYQDEHVTLYHGDCTDIVPQLPRHSIDLLLTDPPYAAAAATVTTGFGREKWGFNWGDLSLVTLLASQVFGQPCLAPGHQAYWFCDHLSYGAMLPFVFARYPLVQLIVWDKDMLGIGGCYRKQTELILYCRDKGAPDLPKDKRDLIRIRPKYCEKEHPAEKPLPLIRELAGASDWQTVLDPFAGSGTTLMAAKELGRKAVGIEVEERYCELIARRLSVPTLALT